MLKRTIGAWVVLCLCSLVAAADGTAPDAARPYFSERARLLMKVAPGAPAPMPRTLYPRDKMEAAWKALPGDDALKARAAERRAKADRWVAIPKERWIEMLPDRAPAPWCNYGEAGGSGYLTACPVTGAKGEAFATFDLERSPHTVTLKANGKTLYERPEDAPEGYEYPIKGTLDVPHWDGQVRKIGFVESPAVILKDGTPLKFYPANIVWDARLKAIIGNWRGGAVQDLRDAYLATGDEKYAERLIFILERLAGIAPHWPLAYYNAVDKQSREDLLEKAEKHIPVGWHGWLGPARLNAGATNFRPPMEGYYYSVLARCFMAVEGSSSWGQGNGAAARKQKVRKDLLKELSYLFASYGAYNCVGNGIGMYAPGLLSAGVALQDRYFFDGYNAILDEFLYNENYYDGISTEGSLNYAGMVGGMWAMWKGRQEYQPDCLEQHPFVAVCGKSQQRMRSLWNVQSQHGDGPNGVFMVGSGPRTQDGKEAREPSEVFGGFGISLLRAGAPGRRLEVFFHHDRAVGHAHPDMLGVQVHFRGIPVIDHIGDARLGRFMELRDSHNPSAKAIRALDYPKPMMPTDDLQQQCDILIDKAENRYGAWAIQLNSCTMTKNTVLVDEYGAGTGLAPWRGGDGSAPKHPVGNLRLFKGGEPADRAEATLQVAEATGDGMLPLHYQGVDTYRRSLLSVTRPDGRPYLVDVFHVVGGNRHLMLWHSRGEPVDSTMPEAPKAAENLEAWLEETFPQRRYWMNRRTWIINEHQIETVRAAANPPSVWHHTWTLDYAAWAPKTAPEGGEAVTARQWHERGVTPVTLRLHGVAMPRDRVAWGLRAKSFYPGILSETVNGKTYNGMVRFKDGLDYVGTMRVNPNQPLNDTQVHVLEPIADGEKPMIASIRPLMPEQGPMLPPGCAGLSITFEDGTRDVVIALSPAVHSFTSRNAEVSLSGRFALVRFAGDGSVTEARVVSGRRLDVGGKTLVSTDRADFRGRVVDLLGDVSGNRHESAVVLKPQADWPIGAALVGRTLSVAFNRGRRIENYRIARVEPADGGAVKVVLADGPPFVDMWGKVQSMEPGRLARGIQQANQFIGEQNAKGGLFGTPYLRGSRIAFPELGMAFTLAGGNEGSKRFDIDAPVNLEQLGVKEGTLYAVYPDAREAEAWVAGESGFVTDADGARHPVGPVRNRMSAGAMP